MNIRMVWLNRREIFDASKPEEHILYLDHVSIGGKFNASGYVVREKVGNSQGAQPPVERLLTPHPMRYSTALKYWHSRAAWCINNGYTTPPSGEYRNRDFIDSNGWPPPLSDPMLEQLSQPNEHVHNELPARELPQPLHTCPLPPPPPISLPPYNPPQPINRKPQPPRAPAPKPKLQPVRRLPIAVGRRIILED